MDGVTHLPSESRNKSWKQIEAKLASTTYSSNGDGTAWASVGSTTVLIRKTGEEATFSIHCAGAQMMAGSWPASLKTLDWIRGEWEGDFDVPLKQVWPVSDDVVPETLKNNVRRAYVEGLLSAPVKRAQSEIETYLGDPWDALFRQLFTRQDGNELVASTLLEAVPGPNMSVAIIEAMWLSNLRPIDVRTAFKVAEAQHGSRSLYNAHRVVMGGAGGAWPKLLQYIERSTPDHRDVNFILRVIKPWASEVATLAQHLDEPVADVMLAETIAMALKSKNVELTQVRRRRRQQNNQHENGVNSSRPSSADHPGRKARLVPSK